jgi:hypothetical protein
MIVFSMILEIDYSIEFLIIFKAEWLRNNDLHYEFFFIILSLSCSILLISDYNVAFLAFKLLISLTYDALFWSFIFICSFFNFYYIFLANSVYSMKELLNKLPNSFETVEL